MESLAADTRFGSSFNSFKPTRLNQNDLNPQHVSKKSKASSLMLVVLTSCQSTVIYSVAFPLFSAGSSSYSSFSSVNSSVPWSAQCIRMPSSSSWSSGKWLGSCFLIKTQLYNDRVWWKRASNVCLLTELPCFGFTEPSSIQPSTTSYISSSTASVNQGRGLSSWRKCFWRKKE